MNTAPLPLPSIRRKSTPPAQRMRIGWDRLSIYLPVLLMGLLAVGSYWLLRATPAALEPPPERALTSEPDYFLRRFSVKVFDPEGVIKNEIFGSEARHRPDTDSMEIDNARIRAVSDQGLLTTATALLITSNADNTEYVMRGNAVVVRAAGTNARGQAVPRLEFHGEYLQVFSEPERVTSDRPVLLLRGNDRIVANTLDYDGTDRVATFNGRVKAQLAPR